jgi:hypothetical protein
MVVELMVGGEGEIPVLDLPTIAKAQRIAQSQRVALCSAHVVRWPHLRYRCPVSSAIARSFALR